jgi:uncharacterized membrane-anchored protein
MFPYNFFSNYDYWNPNPRIQCESCGNTIYIAWALKRCAECNKTICAKCDTYGICPQDFEKLSPDEQQKLILFDELNTKKMLNISTSLIFLTLTLIISIFILISDNIAIIELALVVLIGILVGIGFLGLFVWYWENHQTQNRRTFLSHLSWKRYKKMLPKLNT